MNVYLLQIVMAMFVDNADHEMSQMWHASLAHHYITDESNEYAVARLYPYHCLRGGMRREAREFLLKDFRAGNVATHDRGGMIKVRASVGAVIMWL
jgi:hypothetical protein